MTAEGASAPPPEPVDAGAVVSCAEEGGGAEHGSAGRSEPVAAQDALGAAVTCGDTTPADAGPENQPTEGDRAAADHLPGGREVIAEAGPVQAGAESPGAVEVPSEPPWPEPVASAGVGIGHDRAGGSDVGGSVVGKAGAGRDDIGPNLLGGRGLGELPLSAAARGPGLPTFGSVGGSVARPAGPVAGLGAVARDARRERLEAQTRGGRSPGVHHGARTAALAGGLDGPEALASMLAQVLGALRVGAEARGGPLPLGGPGGVARLLRELLSPDALLPETGDPDALSELTRALAATAADPADPACAAHLHVPPLAVAAAADLAVSALNPSLDSWDQAPGGTEIETAVLRLLAETVGFERPDAARGVFTTGGTESNLMALLLARDRLLAREFAVQGGGAIPAEATGRLRIFCSAAAHFSLSRAATVLGLGSEAVVPVEVTEDGAMDPRLLDWTLADARTAGHVPCCVVATAGTTDLGAVDPLRGIAAVARRHGVPLHVDAAYGGGALFSRTLAPLLDGLCLADTVGLDLHKLGWQPVAAGVLLAADAATLSPLEQRVAYLNPADDEDAGYASLLGRSLRTTRRLDAFKVAVTLRTVGRAGLGSMVDRCHELARHAARVIAADPRLELVAEPVLTTVLFRYLPEGPAADGGSDTVNAELRRLLLANGTAVVGRTELPGAGGGVRLKLTLLNPHTSEADLDRLLALVVAAGVAVEQKGPERAGPAQHRPSKTEEKPA